MTKELDKHEGAASSQDVASSPEKSQISEGAPKQRKLLLVAMACVLALVAGVGIWGTQLAKDSPALTTVAKEETSAKEKTSASSSADGKAEDTNKASSSASSAHADKPKEQPSAPTTSAASPAAATSAEQVSSAAPSEQTPAKPETSAVQETPANTTTVVTVVAEPEPASASEPVAQEPAAPSEPVVVEEQVVEPEPEPEPEPTSLVVSVYVDGSPAGGNVRSATVELSVGSSVYDALVASGANVNARGTTFGTYVAAIDGLAEREHGAMSGWVYAVNGVEPQTACSNYKLKDGDSVVWTYVNVE